MMQRFMSKKRSRRKGGENMFRKFAIAVANVVVLASTTVGSAEARWGWRGGGWGWGWGGFGVGLGTGLLLAAATRPYWGGYYGYPYAMAGTAIRMATRLLTGMDIPLMAMDVV